MDHLRTRTLSDHARRVEAACNAPTPLSREHPEAFPPVRTFTTGATRDTEENKFDYEGFLSPQVVRRFGAYMHKHRVQADGKLRDSDNWQKGMPFDAYMKSLFRHFMDAWSLHRGLPITDPDGEAVTLEDALCACLFNIQGYLHELLREQEGVEQGTTVGPASPVADGGGSAPSHDGYI